MGAHQLPRRGLLLALLALALAAPARAEMSFIPIPEIITDPAHLPGNLPEERLAIAREAARQSIVLLENRNGVLPLHKDRLRSVAVVGPLADDDYEQLGTWVFDGDADLCVTCLRGIRELVGGDVEIHHVPAMETSRSRSTDGFEAAVATARRADAVVLFLGEEAILSGEAHSRADIGLRGPGHDARAPQTIETLR